MKNLSKNGLSMSQAQSISNLCNQRCKEIDQTINVINNYSKSITIDEENYFQIVGSKMPGNIVLLLKEKGMLHATQAFLMENIKEKNNYLETLKKKVFVYDVEPPQPPNIITYQRESEVDEAWGWKQLSRDEYNEYLLVEAQASHIGQFIHKGGKLDRLRSELPNLPSLEWFEIEVGKKTPMKITPHHKPKELLVLHEELAALHRSYEQRVNYYKAKVKNMVSDRNAEITRDNSNLIADVAKINDGLSKAYQAAYSNYMAQENVVKEKFEELRHNEIKEFAQLRIEVDPRFKEIVDSFLTD